jgi:hypothetical protein
MKERTHISFVVVARNDNYGGNFLHRFNVFINNLLTLCELYSLESELIIVEWNPPEDRPLLRDAIAWPDAPARHISVRIIQVPRDVHNSLPNPAGLFLFEYLGKNVGVRRASSEYILVTNPDVIFNEYLIKFLASGNLSPKCFYRIDRYDVKGPVPFDNVQSMMTYCRNNVVRVNSRLGSYPQGTRVSFRRQTLFFLSYIRHFPQGPAHTNASGDFLIMHHDAWFKLRGYPELETQGKSHHIDSLMVHQARLAGYRQIVITQPACLYHQDHERGEGSKPMSEAVATLFKQLRKARKPIMVNDEKWGLGGKDLPESLL